MTHTHVLEHIAEHARQRPDHPALLAEAPGGRRWVSYAALVERFREGAERLRAAGVGAGERCGLVARQGPAFVEEALSILAAGACLVPIPDDHAGAALERFAQRAHLQHLVVQSEGFTARRLPGAAPLEGGAEQAFRDLEPAYLRFTSGTTSQRKGVILSHRRIAERLEAANQALGIGPEDRILWLLPMAHHFVVSILLYLRFGATILLPARALAEPILELAGREGASVFYASPYHYHLLSKDAGEAGLDGVRLAISTAEGLREDVARRFRARFDMPLCQALGIIEVGLPVINIQEAERKPLALGRPLPAYDVWLRDEDGKPVTGRGSPECAGEICIRGPGLFDAYLEPWLPSERCLEPDGFRTGDQGFFDADGTLHLVGRRHNRISMAGLKFFSEEVERVLLQHPAVRECRVFGREHAHLGEIPVAEIVPEDAAAPPQRAELTRHCREGLPAYQVPREFRVVAELERTETGKLKR